MVTAIRANLERIGALPFARGLCARNGVELDAVLGQERYRSTMRVRHELWHVVHDTLGHDLSETGRVFGVDHTTVRSAIYRRGAQWL